MSWESHLENLRSKPVHIKKRIAFWSSFGITGFIFLFWMASFNSLGTSSPSLAVVEQTESPSQSLTASVGAIFTDIKEIFLSPKKIVYPEIEVLPGDK